MNRVFDLLLTEKIIPSTTVSAFHRYLDEQAFRVIVESRLLTQDRVSLATLAGPLPCGMSHRTMIAVLYDMRHRSRQALDRQSDLDFKTSLNLTRYHAAARVSL